MLPKGIYLPTSKILLELPSDAVHLLEDQVLETGAGHSRTDAPTESTTTAATITLFMWALNLKCLHLLKPEMVK